jgi:hypothetical protein
MDKTYLPFEKRHDLADTSILSLSGGREVGSKSTFGHTIALQDFPFILANDRVDYVKA